MEAIDRTLGLGTSPIESPSPSSVIQKDGYTPIPTHPYSFGSDFAMPPAEVLVKCSVLNRMAQLGMPEAVRVG